MNKKPLYASMPFLSAAAGLIIWEILGRIEISPLFPSFTEILTAWLAVLSEAETYRNIALSLITLIYGFGAAVLIGIPLGLLMGYYQKIDQALGVIINAVQGAPMAAFVPVLMVLYGTGPLVQISVVFLFAFFVICIGAESGAKGVDKNLAEMARSFGANGWTIFRRIVLPSSARYIFSGLYMGIIRSIQGLVTAEMLVTLKGIGAEVMYYGQAFLTDYLFATILNILILAVILGRIVRFAGDCVLKKMNQGGVFNA